MLVTTHSTLDFFHGTAVGKIWQPVIFPSFVISMADTETWETRSSTLLEVLLCNQILLPSPPFSGYSIRLQLATCLFVPMCHIQTSNASVFIYSYKHTYMSNISTKMKSSREAIKYCIYKRGKSFPKYFILCFLLSVL